MLVDPWSVSPQFIDQLATQSFAASLFPYLAFLYFLSREQTDCPPLANFGFQFLLAFVFATIPAGIYAKLHYHDILANVDWLHGAAESLLTVTNLIIVLGFRKALQNLESSSPPPSSPEDSTTEPSSTANTPPFAALVAFTMAAATLLPGASHLEPNNALSLPTWVIHVSSLLEWLAAMSLVWRYAELTRRPRWKGLVWGMLPLHTSGLCACSYHLLYNSPTLNGLVALQAALTCFGNATMAVATWRVMRAGGETPTDEAVGVAGAVVKDAAVEQGGALEPNGAFWGKLVGTSVAASVAIKWGSLYLDWPFEARWSVALTLIFGPTALNVAKWALRSSDGRDLL